MYQMYPDESSSPPRLKLEVIHGGPGSGGRTAVGTMDGGDPNSGYSVLDDPPWWFWFISLVTTRKFRKYFAPLSIGDSMDILREAEIPQMYRVALALRWGVIVPDRDDLSIEDFASFWPHVGPISAELDRIEFRSTYKLWKKFGMELPYEQVVGHS